MYEFASSSATLLTVYTAVMHTRRMNVIPEAELWNYDKDDQQSQWEMLKFDPQLPLNPLSDRHQIRHA